MHYFLALFLGALNSLLDAVLELCSIIFYLHMHLYCIFLKSIIHFIVLLVNFYFLLVTLNLRLNPNNFNS